jgi:hypothetical protein
MIRFRYVERAVAAGVDARLDVWMGMPHGFAGGIGNLKRQRKRWMPSVRFSLSGAGSHLTANRKARPRRKSRQARFFSSAELASKSGQNNRNCGKDADRAACSHTSARDSGAIAALQKGSVVSVHGDREHPPPLAAAFSTATVDGALLVDGNTVAPNSEAPFKKST